MSDVVRFSQSLARLAAFCASWSADALDRESFGGLDKVSVERFLRDARERLDFIEETFRHLERPEEDDDD